MSGPHDPKGKKFSELVSAYLHGQLSPEEASRLEQLLHDSIEHRDRFVREAYIYHQAGELIRGDARADLMEGAAAGGVVELTEDDLADPSDGSSAMAFVIDQALAERRKHDIEDEANRRLAAQLAEDARNWRYELRQNATPEPVQRVIVIPKAVVWLGLAAVLLLGAVLIGIDLPARTTPPPPIAEHQDPQDTQQNPATPDPVATLTLLDDAIWSGADQPLSLYSRVRPGVLRLESGIAHFVMDSGAVVMLKGPATIDLSSAWVAELSEGSAVAQVPEQAQGFRIVGDGFAVTDLGTEFAVHVDRDGMRCQVVLGEVELAVTEPGTSRGTVRRLRENRAVVVDAAAGTVRDVAPAESEDISWALPYTAYLHTNLVVNGDFEAGPIGFAHSLYRVENVEIPGWENDGHATVVGYQQAGSLGADAYPDPATDPVPEQRGQAYYIGAAPGTMTQTVDLSELAPLIDRGQAKYILSGDLGGFLHQDDWTGVAVVFYDVDGRYLAEQALDRVDAQARGNQTGFFYRESVGSLPVGARSARISVSAHHSSGDLTDAYADNLALVIEAESLEAYTGNSPLGHRGDTMRR